MRSIRPISMTAALLLATQLLTGCASAHNPDDPLEPFNRGVYHFNDSMDRAVVKPVAQGYDTVMPELGKIAINNFISNLDDVLVTANDLLQFKFAQAASDGARVLINTTFGLGGLVNVAHRLKKHNEDFGQTLGYWGVGSGPYLVLPFFGPSSVRDGIGLYVDTSAGVPNRIDDIATRNQYYVGNFIHVRASLLDQGELLDEAALDRYSFMRESYMMYRKNLVYDGNPPRANYYDEEYDDTGE